MEMKKSLILAFAALLLVGLTACHREDPELDLTAAEYVFKSEGGSTSISFQCNYKWKATSSSPWIHISPESGDKGSNTLTITVDANTGTSSRTGSVNVVCEDLMRGVRVTQAQPFSQSLSLVFSGTELEAPLLAGNSLNAEIDWGDGVKETYAKDLKHTYASGGNHTVTLKIAGAGSFELGTVAGISEIDLSAF